MPKNTKRSTASKKTTARKSTTSNVFLWKKHGLYLVLALILGTALFLCGTGWRLYRDSQNLLQIAQHTEIEGTLAFTALRPEPKNTGTVVLFARRYGSENWQQLKNVSLSLEQDAPWKWDGALPGTVYDLQAVLTIDGKEIKKSEIITTTAPSYGLEIPLEVNWKDLPDAVVEGSQAKLGGTITLNGFIPPSASVEVYVLDPQHYEEVLHDIDERVLAQATSIAAVPSPGREVEWLWNGAVPKQEYVLVSVLKNLGQVVGISDQIIKADAGELRIKQTINSQVQPTQGVSGLWNISGLLASSTIQSGTALNIPANALAGTVFIDGPKHKDTSLLMLWRKPGEANYQVVNRYNAPSHRGTDWSWNDAVPGQQYEIMAALQVDGNNSSTLPNPVTVTAPAHNIDMRINTYYVMPRTSGQPSNQVCIDSNGKESTAVLILPKMADATQYWLQVGDNPAQAGVYNQKFPAPDGDVKVQVRVQNGKQQYMRYSYATCDNCSSDQDFAPYSDTVGFTCN